MKVTEVNYLLLIYYGTVIFFTKIIDNVEGGYWSQKHGLLPIDNEDGSNHLIYNPARANQNYFDGTVIYKNGSIFLWVKRR